MIHKIIFPKNEIINEYGKLSVNEIINLLKNKKMNR